MVSGVNEGEAVVTEGAAVAIFTLAFLGLAYSIYPYVVIDPNGDKRAIVCVGTICLAPVSTPAAVGDALLEATFPAPGGRAGDGVTTARA